MPRWVCLVFAFVPATAPAGPPAPGFKVPPGFVVEEFAGPALANDITHMTIDPAGRVLVAGRGYVRVLADDNNDGQADRAIDLLDNLKDSPMGMLAEAGSLFVSTDGGLQQYTGYNGSAKLTARNTILTARTASEHDAHAIRRGPDGRLYVICGNFTGFTKPAITSLNSPVKEPVAGVLIRIHPTTNQVETIADGFRNAYDFDFDLKGELFTYDSDNERCVSLPWYEPCRFYHVVPGGNYGWMAPQGGTFWRKPPYFLDVIPPVCTTGRGSPTACVAYRHSQFPEPYRGEFFLADWTFGKVFFVKREWSGSRYSAKPEVFLEGTGDNGFAPTAMAVHPITGELYVSIGGRGTRGAVYRVRHQAGEANPKPLPMQPRNAGAPQAYPERLRATSKPPAIDGNAIQSGTQEQQLFNLRLLQLSVGGLTAANSRGTVAEGYTFARTVTRASADPWCAVFRNGFPGADRLVNLERARTLAALEDQTPEAVSKVASLLTEISDAVDDFHYLAVLSRLPGARSEADTKRIATALLALDRKYEAAKLTRDAYWPLRLAEASRELLRIDRRLPGLLLTLPEFGRPDHVLFATLPGMDAPTAARKFLQAASTTPEYAWSPGLVALLGKLPEGETTALLRTLWDRPQLQDSIALILAKKPAVEDRAKFIDVLRSADPEVVRSAAEALGKIPPPADGTDLPALIRALRQLPNEKAVANAREAIAVRLQARTNQRFAADAKAWESWLTQTYPALAAKLGGSVGFDAPAWKARVAAINWNAGNPVNGQQVFVRATCIACHNGPRALGPSLQGVAKRFSKDDMLTTVLEPNRDVSPRYRPMQVLTKEGKAYTGMVIYDAVDGMILATAADATVRIPGDAIESKRTLETSIMPAGLLDKLPDRDIADLFAYMRTLTE